MDESTLIQSAQRGELEAFNQLILRYQNFLFSIAMRMLGDEDAASDVLQKALISTFRNFNTFRGGSLRSWLARVTVNACYDELRRNHRRPTLRLDQVNQDEEEIESGPWLKDPSAEPEALVESTELQSAIERCIQSLAPGYRTILILVDVEGMSYEEAARVAQIPVGTVKSRLGRARMQMRRALQSCGDLLPMRYQVNIPIKNFSALAY
jgi:RNA polymerase sigma-70 factor, ECF subfamily